MPIIARKGKGTQKVLDALKDDCLTRRSPLKINYGDDIEETLMKIQHLIGQHSAINKLSGVFNLRMRA